MYTCPKYAFCRFIMGLEVLKEEGKERKGEERKCGG